MKRLALMALGAAGLFAQSPVRSVYILPMANGLDQYLANRITESHTMVVVADPKAADAVLTDRLGQSFEQQLDQLEGKKADGTKSDDPRPSFRSASGRGTVFLVDAHSRRVLWSDYEKPNGNPTREADRISKKLQAFGK
jgi:hypothetical protein